MTRPTPRADILAAFETVFGVTAVIADNPRPVDDFNEAAAEFRRDLLTGNAGVSPDDEQMADLAAERWAS